MEILDGVNVIATETLSNGQATFVTSALAESGHALGAAYQGDGANATSASNTVNLTVQQAPTTTTLSAGANSSTYGDAVTFTVTVGGNASVAPTGTVQFMQGDTVLGTAELAPGTAGSQAVFTTPYLDPGSQAIQAEYAGDGVNAGSASNILTLTVTPLAPPPVQQAPDGTQYVYEFDGDAGVDQAPVERDDALGRLVQFIDAAGGVTDVSYNDAAGAATITDPLGDVTTLAPNSQGLLVPQADPSATAAYGDQGQLTSLTDAGGNVRSFAYDDTGRVFSVTWTDSSGNTRGAWHRLCRPVGPDRRRDPAWGHGRNRPRLRRVHDVHGPGSCHRDAAGAAACHSSPRAGRPLPAELQQCKLGKGRDHL